MGAWIEAAGPKGKMGPWPEEWRKGRVKRERAGERQNGTELTGHEERGNPCRSLVYNRGIWRSRNAEQPLRIGLVLLHLIKYLTRSRTYVADVVSWIRDVSSTGAFKFQPCVSSIIFHDDCSAWVDEKNRIIIGTFLTYFLILIRLKIVGWLSFTITSRMMLKMNNYIFK